MRRNDAETVEETIKRLRHESLHKIWKDSVNKLYKNPAIEYDNYKIVGLYNDEEYTEEITNFLERAFQTEDCSIKNNQKQKQIVIKAEKIMGDNGSKKLKIVSIENVLGKDKLPIEYFKNSENCFYKSDMVENSIVLGLNNQIKEIKYNRVSVGDVLSEDSFINLIGYIKRCGKYLREINKKIEKEKNDWKGTETFTI